MQVIARFAVVKRQLVRILITLIKQKFRRQMKSAVDPGGGIPGQSMTEVTIREIPKMEIFI